MLASTAAQQAGAKRGPVSVLSFTAMEPALHDRSNDDDPVVLVVDDDPDVREGLRALFQSVNLKSMAYGSAPELLHS